LLLFFLRNHFRRAFRTRLLLLCHLGCSILFLMDGWGDLFQHRLCCICWVGTWVGKRRWCTGGVMNYCLCYGC
jgi:hypothetical protein